ncbi:conserved hypothetical protein [Paraburkholderia ribeironis]|uniref:Uncharacterized protein n=1 Tax=Paraburkholderia ribeironis TaxID=1247936 RepID=A0A1N7SED4_9BURK|nr:hypothetical protein [Paraburkholderia ribeironis]SIT45753.1 conserved hypothetical protein [Paraburkholderia ribeironis]
MNRPLALIQGNLALPDARLLRGLPAPYGVYRWPARAAAQNRPRAAVSTEAQRTGHEAVRLTAPLARQHPFASGSKFRFFYTLPKPRDYSSRWDAQLAEARQYLETGNTFARSSRADHVLGAAIFVACAIVLTWLLTTSATHGDDQSATIATIQPTVPAHVAPEEVHPRASSRAVQPAGETTPTIEGGSARHGATHRVARADRATAAARASEARVDERQAPDRFAYPAERPSLSVHPEWTTRSSADGTIAQAHQPSDQPAQHHVKVAPRPDAPSSADADWNAHMTQRRITDNPNAFEVPGGQH